MKMSRSVFFGLSISALAALVAYSNADAALRITNSSLMKNQTQVNATERATQVPQPARTATDTDGTTVAVSEADMNACKMIYPNGHFEWVKPTTGSKRGGPATCAALVELRYYKNVTARDYTVLASAYLAAGDSMNCHIDDFDTITLQGREFTYPADKAPTLEDVAKVMAEENRQNAGFKILAATVVGGLGGNLLGKGEAGKDSGLGLSGDKLKTTAMGAAGAAALMTASTQINDYKTGSMILSGGINMAAGAAAGNLMASGDEILKIDKCKIKSGTATVDSYCVYGVYDKDGINTKTYEFDGLENPKDTESKKIGLFYNFKEQASYKCERRKKKSGDTEKYDDSWDNCVRISLQQITFDFGDFEDESKKCAEGKNYISTECLKLLKDLPTKDQATLYGYNKSEDTQNRNGTTQTGKRFLKEIKKGGENAESRVFVKIASAEAAGKQVSAMVKINEEDAKKFFGYKIEKWDDLMPKLPERTVYDLKGTPLDVEEQTYDIEKYFTPSRQSADDGDVIDFNNKARTKSTLIGGGVGAGLGALSGATSAEAEIQERWAAAKREYEGSLGHVSCSTGEKYLSQYNSIVILPEMVKQE